MGESIFGRSDSCCLCEEIRSGEFPAQYRSVYSVESRMSRLGGDFVALPTVSPLKSGHVLVLPDRHVGSLADLPASTWHTLLESVRSTVTQLAETFSAPFYFFEHGARIVGTSCGIDHAHLHVLPLSAAMANAVRSRVQVDFPTCEQGTFIDILSLAARRIGQPYLLHGFDLESIQIAFDSGIPSQYMRQVIAQVQQTPKWDWKLLAGRDEFLSTCGALRQL
jgi:diadenosine tetraphosphate (Ap4A) HIT family hydrolase